MHSSPSPLLLIVETHPIQYRAPVYARLQQLCPNSFHVVYASDYSVRGGTDHGFRQDIAWDTDLLAGYPSSVLRTDLNQSPRSWNGLDGRGVVELINQLRPSAILLNSLNYRYDHVVYFTALFKRIPLWMRCDTNDVAFPRSRLKTLLRWAYYRLFYAWISQAFPVGELNRQHWLRHGMRPQQLTFAHHCTRDQSSLLPIHERQNRRQLLREKLGITPDQLLVAFFGKLIPKKDPFLLLQAAPFLSFQMRQRLNLLYVGSGELLQELQSHAIKLTARFGVPVQFPGFVNQSALVDWYLAADLVVLPSRQAGETWGLVVNEAMQAGCGVVATEAVGCTADFGGWERFRTIPVGSAQQLALALQELAAYPRSFDWAAEDLKQYSIEAAAQAFATAIAELD